jgi:hypothetical protein
MKPHRTYRDDQELAELKELEHKLLTATDGHTRQVILMALEDVLALQMSFVSRETREHIASTLTKNIPLMLDRANEFAAEMAAKAMLERLTGERTPIHPAFRAAAGDDPQGPQSGANK